MKDFKHDLITVNGIEIHYVEQGSGPLVLLCHGFPESWYSWRHQIPALASAGYRVVALDMRGYGQTSQPAEIEAYGLSSLVGDVVQAVSVLGEEQSVIVGHDWGGPVAWYAALMRPDVFRAVVSLSVPYNKPLSLPDGITLNDVMRQVAGDRDYYRLFFQEPGVAEADLEADIRKTMLGLLYSISGDIVRDGVHSIGWDGHFTKGETLTDQLVIPDELPPWLSEEDLTFYIDEITRSGFRGGINWYRNIKNMTSILAPFVGCPLNQPSLYLYGEYDLIAGNSAEAIEALPSRLGNLQGLYKLEGAGHWLQQEKPEEVNRALIKFLDNL
ncbi:MAG: alpha/beta hydrolase [Pseudomonadota bacterium]|nr:alpha/beta hydrolase [Pseudomonadota bacterium]